jgi:hypothetical protein
VDESRGVDARDIGVGIRGENTSQLGLQDSGGDVDATTDTEDNMVEEVSTVKPREEPREVVDDIVKVAIKAVDDEEVVSAFDSSEDEDYWESSAEGAEDESYRESSTDIAEEEEYRESMWDY